MAIRLIHTDSLCLTSFMGDTVPKYAILSHTWESGEISFQEMMQISEHPEHLAAKKLGYSKIVDASKKAKSMGLDYVWVDTCCIDKTSSSELSEAINSMYQWYQKAEICFVFLRDFNKASDDCQIDLAKCRWFTRGWCLQELVAPKIVEFFDVNWHPIGSRADLTSIISKITRIDEQVLVDNTLIDSLPVARRMSWAAGRQTTREEDMAYCLLGIFSVNMPMLYGEGPRAFLRLQEEIIRRSNDLSIFAFQNAFTNQAPPGDACGSPQLHYCDLFATCPGDFAGCEDLDGTGTNVHSSDAFALTNKGLHFQRAKLQVNIQRGSYSMLLNCKPAGRNMAMMHLQKVGPGLFARFDARLSAGTAAEADLDRPEDYSIEIEEAYIINKVTPSARGQLQLADEYAIHVSSRDHDVSRALQVLQRSTSSDRWDSARMQFLTKGDRLFGGYWKLFPSLVKRLGEAKHDFQAPPGQCYLVCGAEYSEASPEPRVWVRLYSTEEWRTLEAKFGIITKPNDGSSPLGAGHTNGQITLGKGQPTETTITAFIKLQPYEGKPRFELELDFKQEPKNAPDTQGQG
jgi:hypothetical protein